MLRSVFARADIALRAAAATTVFALSAASVAQAAVHTSAVRLASAGVIAPAAASGASFTTIDDKNDPTFNQLLGINNEGVISGYFGSGAKGHPNKGYFIAPPYTSFQNVNLPASAQTQDTGINDKGYSTGFWSPTDFGPTAGGAPQDANFGFIRLQNVLGNNTVFYLSVNPAVTGSAPFINQVLGVNDSGNAVGFYNDPSGASHAYLYSLETSNFTPISVATATSAAATGISNKGLVCGFYVNPNNNTKGFVAGPGLSVHFGVTGSANTQFLGINSLGEVVGFYADGSGIDHGILFHLATGMAETINAPGGVGGTVLNGINDKGQVVGFYTDNKGNVHGLLVNGLK